MTNTEALHHKLYSYPPAQRERYAAIFLTALENEEDWEQVLADTTAEQCSAMQDMARNDSAQGEMPLADFLKSREGKH